jgi:hypothetical protein
MRTAPLSNFKEIKMQSEGRKDLTDYGYFEVYHGDIYLLDLCPASLKGAPKEVRGNFDCSGIWLTSLSFAPTKVFGSFNCCENQLRSLEGCPKEVGSHFACQANNLTSLKHSPNVIFGEFNCENNYINSFAGAPQRINGDFLACDNSIKSLKDIHKHIKELNGIFDLAFNPIESHVLGLLLIEGITEVILDNKEVEAIVKKYLGTRDVFSAQEELIDARLEEYAKL